jgi:hypothetical protein
VTAHENLGRALQADSAPARPPAGAPLDRRAWVVGASGGGWRRRDRLEAAVEAFREAVDLAGGRASRDALRGLGYSLRWLGRDAESAAVFEHALARGVWSARHQYPGELRPGLESAPFPPAARVACVLELLERRAPALVAEAAALLAADSSRAASPGASWPYGAFRPEREGLHSPSDGFAYYDLVSGCATPAGRAVTPASCDALDALAWRTNAPIGLARISRLQRGVEIAPHTGLRNTRWRVHLGLRVPDSAAHVPTLHVAGEAVTWQVGRAFVFDDSYEHEVRWDPPVEAPDLSAAAARLVLIVDLPHPDMAEREGTPVC